MSVSLARHPLPSTLSDSLTRENDESGQVKDRRDHIRRVGGYLGCLMPVSPRVGRFSTIVQRKTFAGHPQLPKEVGGFGSYTRHWMSAVRKASEPSHKGRILVNLTIGRLKSISWAYARIVQWASGLGATR